MKLYGRSYSRCHRTFPPTAFGRFSIHSSEIRSTYQEVRLANFFPRSSKLVTKSVAGLISCGTLNLEVVCSQRSLSRRTSVK